MRPSPLKTLERVSLVLGILLFSGLLYRVGLRAVGESLVLVGWGFAAILALFAVAAALNALGWRAVLPSNSGIPFPSLLGFQSAGDAINVFTPGVIGGELLRVSLLRRRLPAVPAAASVALAAGCQFVAQCLFVIAGLPWVIGRLLGSPMRTGFILAAGTAAAMAVTAAALLTRSDLFERLHAMLARILPKRFGSETGASWKALDGAIFGALRNRRPDLGLAVGLYFVGWSLGAVEIGLILRLLGAGVDWRTCVSIEVVAVILDAVLFFVPGRLGTQEGGKYAIFGLLGLPPSLGFAVGVVKRLREIVWAAAGLAVLAFIQRRRRSAEASNPTPPAASCG